jgi:hypothetical protein
MKDSGRDLYEANESPPQPLPAVAIESFAAVIEAMQGRSSGTAVGFSCEKGVGTPTNRTIAAEGEISEPLNFVLHATVSSRGSSRNARLRIEIRDRQELRVNSSAATLFAASERSLEFGQRILGGDAKELYWRIDVDGRRSMQIQQLTYASGTLIEASIWKLEKPF